jgi:DnaJ-domain-containing protein 1
MLPDHLCRRDVPGLDEAILASEYAQLERLSEEEVIASIAARRLLGANARGVWYVEAPSFCEAGLSRLRSRRQRPHEDAPNNGQSQPPTEPVSEEIAYARVLGLSGRVTFDDIKRHYRERVREYHPDKVAALGPKLRELAEDEMKKINAAYEFFTAKYGNNRKTER